jgi:hypothetical protein
MIRRRYFLMLTSAAALAPPRCPAGGVIDRHSGAVGESEGTGKATVNRVAAARQFAFEQEFEPVPVFYRERYLWTLD